MSTDTPSTSSAPWARTPPLCVLVFVHGFKGDDKTFMDYPQRLQHSLTQAFSGRSEVHAWVYPAFETRGELSQCVQSFGEWLTTRIAELEMEHAAKQEGTAKGKKELARVVLIGHSMGGLVVADFARSIVTGYAQAAAAAKSPQGSGETDAAQSQAQAPASYWPRIVGILAYDTPYLGVHPGVFKNAAAEGWGYVQQAQAVASSVGAGWAFLQTQTGGSDGKGKGRAAAASDKGKAPGAASGKGKQRAADQNEGPESALTEGLRSAGKAAQSGSQAQGSASGSSWLRYGYAAAGATALAAAAGTAWYSRQQIAATASNSQLWVSSHLEFVGVLWKLEALRDRLVELMDMSEDHSVHFHCYHTLINPDKRTFVYLPNENNLPADHIRAQRYFSSSFNSTAKTEVEAHCAMFDPAFDAVYTLGTESSVMIRAWLEGDARKR